MRNQIEAAERIGIRAKTINSTNRDDWSHIEQDLRKDRIDLLLISPERLANDSFRENVLSQIAARVGLLVVDEAHCISDWGHEFRPDYRRIAQVLEALPGNIPVLATTATANDRVVADVASQLGDAIDVVRGPLRRDTLKLQNITLPSPAARMAWLARVIPSLPGSGIVYTLTKRTAERVAEWLCLNDIRAQAYHAGIDKTDATETNLREELEQRLLRNEVKVLVATVALGMGFDKADLGFVIHFQRPASVVHYYQQVGRAGRAIEEAFGVLLHGAEDDDIADYFFRSAFPPQADVDQILTVLRGVDGGLSVPELEARLNLRRSQLKKALKYMSVEPSAPITKIESKWNATAASHTYSIDQRHIDAILDIRKQEQAEMQRYMEHRGCLMQFLAEALDDPQAGPCGICAGCKRQPLLSPEVDHDLANKAAVFLKRSHQSLLPRKQWPPHGALPTYGFTGNIGDDLGAMEGRVLSLWRDAGWGLLVEAGKYETHRFDDELVRACVDMVHQWGPEPAPEWVTCIPSLERPDLVPEFAQRLASALGLPFRASLRKVVANKPQKEMENSFQQARNLDGVFAVDPASIDPSPCLLVDDIVDSRWTMTVGASLLRQAGCEAVFPVALALNR
jgi:ATP-dependent DNA helicase RecQ